MWLGYYIKDKQKIELAIKDFICPLEGGVITGHTTDGKKVKGQIESSHKLVFELEAANGDTLYFEGKVSKTDQKLINGNYGFEEGEMVDYF